MKQEKTYRFPEAELKAFRKVCKERGIKVTPQRLEIYREVMKAHGHPSAEEIYSRVRERLPSISLDTVYRTLSAFESYGLIGRIQTVDRIRFDPNTKLHHHLLCKLCKGLTDFRWDDFDELAPPRDVSDWGHPETKHVQISGVCSKCAEEGRKQ